ncbi:MAG: alcohol dehydrogenase [Deltaproteobacteria bacterium]|jgi:NADPH2:quinone reductase|nr:alcohol dehydrogenase [Deltaproteobacteria bacterium]
MDAWIVREDGDPWAVFRREEVPEPSHDAMAGLALDVQGLRRLHEGEEPCRDYVILRVLCAALAWPDVTMANGSYPVPVEKPYISGQEAVGIVEDASPSMRHLLGKRVVAFAPQPFGSFATWCIGTAPTVWECPEAFSDEEAAAFFIAAHTAYHAVHRRGRVQAGEDVLVLGAAGGVPSACVQLALAAGANVIAVAGGPAKVEFCRKLGAQTVLDHREVDVVARARELTAGRGVDMIVDFVQGEQGAATRPALAVEGRHVMAGHAGGLKPVHPHEFYIQNWTLVGCCMGYGYDAEQLVAIEQQAHDAIVDLVERELYRPLVGEVVGFDDVPEALRKLVAREVMGRIVVRVGTA